MTLSSAVHAGEVLRFDYSGAEPLREPHHLVTWDGRWYLLAWDLGREGWRIFRADRIAPRIPCGPRFSPRQLLAGDVVLSSPAGFRARIPRRLALPWRGYPAAVGHFDADIELVGPAELKAAFAQLARRRTNA